MPGVWLTPRSDRGDEVRRILNEARLPDGYLFTAEYQGGSSLAAMVGNAWDLGELARGSDEFIAAFGGDVSPDPLARVIDLVHAWRRFPWIDPGLQAQFLPAPWSGTAASDLFTGLHAHGRTRPSPSGSSCWPGRDGRVSAASCPAYATSGQEPPQLAGAHPAAVFAADAVALVVPVAGRSRQQRRSTAIAPLPWLPR